MAFEMVKLDELGAVQEPLQRPEDVGGGNLKCTYVST
jgi:hypothetical protein